ncbi:unnamed protein product, partial [Brassica oleracea var. botrytis]
YKRKEKCRFKTIVIFQETFLVDQTLGSFPGNLLFVSEQLCVLWVPTYEYTRL